MTKRDIALILAGALLGALPGYLLAISLNDGGGQSTVQQISDRQESSKPEQSTGVEEVEEANRIITPANEAECAVLIAQAETETGAQSMQVYCIKRFPDIYKN